jgi:hypothetical protein
LRPNRRAAVVLAGVLWLVPLACAEPYINYSCANGSRFTLIFEKSGTALIMIEGGALRLEPKHPATGLWFASYGGEFHERAGKATFWMLGRAKTTCRRTAP